MFLLFAIVRSRIGRRCRCATRSAVVFITGRYRVKRSVAWSCAVLFAVNCLAQPRHLDERAIRHDTKSAPVEIGDAALLSTLRKELRSRPCESPGSSFSPTATPRTYWDPRSQQRSARQAATSCLVCPIERPVDRIDELFPRNPAATQRICLKPPPKSLPLKTTARIR